MMSCLEIFASVLYLKCPYWTLEKKYWETSTVSNALRSKGIIVIPDIPNE